MKAVTLMVQSLPLLRVFSAQNSTSSFDPARQDIFQRKFNALMKEKDIQGFL
jgi:phosphoheptose isomerase